MRPRRVAPARCKNGVVTQCDTCTAFIGALRGGAGRDQRIVVCFDLQSVGQQAFLPHVRALVRTNGVRVGGGGRGAWCVVVVSGTVDTPERPDEALTGPSKTGPVCCGTSTARRPHGRPFAGHRGGGHQTCATGLGRVRRGRGVRCGARLLEPSPRLHDRRNTGSGAAHGTRSTHHLPTRAGPTVCALPNTSPACQY